MLIKIKRIYSEPTADDGYRILVDRLWPRGIRKEAALLDGWCKTIAPSTELRRLFRGGEMSWDAFVEHYTAELDQHQAPLQSLVERASSEAVTLLFASKDRQHNHAAVLRDYLNAMA